MIKYLICILLIALGLTIVYLGVDARSDVMVIGGAGIASLGGLSLVISLVFLLWDILKTITDKRR